MMLEDNGCETYEAGNASQAIAILAQHPDIAVVFTDIQMPGTMDGVALAKYVRERWPPTIIVVSSGKAQPAKGVLDDDISYLSKPYEPNRLKYVIDNIRGRLTA